MALAGQWTSPLLWTFTLGVSAMALWALMTMAPGLAHERFRPPTEGIDTVALRWIRVSALATLVIAPLDSGRLHWSPAISDSVRYGATLGMLGAFVLVFYAMTVNRFFSAVIRIQKDRGHEVVDFGPYAIIRHPGYAGMIVGVPLMAIALGSWWGFTIAVVYALLILNRVAVEDRYLRTNLPGYAEYSSRVRSRLVPGIW